LETVFTSFLIAKLSVSLLRISLVEHYSVNFGGIAKELWNTKLAELQINGVILVNIMLTTKAEKEKETDKEKKELKRE
jgi:hypothetical protein